MSSKIATILEVLGDGKWHEIEEMQLKCDLPSEEMREIFAFLGTYGLAENDKSHNRVRIKRDFRKILAQTIT